MNVADGIAALGRPVQPAARRPAGRAGRDRRRDPRQARPAADRRGKEARDQALHRRRRGVPAVPAGPLSLEQGHDRRLQEGDRVLPAGDREGPEVRARLRGAGRLVPVARLVLGRGDHRGEGGRACKALQLDPNLAEAHVALGHIKLLARLGLAGRRDASSSRASRSTARRRSRTTSTRCTSPRCGRVADAIAEVKRAQELDPLSPIVNTDLGWYLLYAGQAAEAVAQFRKTIEFDANSVSAHRGLGVALSRDGRYDEAIDELKRALDAVGEQPGHAGPPGRRLRARRAQGRRRGRADASCTTLAAPPVRALIVGRDRATPRSGDKARALDWLQKGVRRARFLDRAARRRAVVRDAAQASRRFEQLVGEAETARRATAIGAPTADLISRLPGRQPVDLQDLHALRSTFEASTNVIAPGVRVT